MNFLRVIGLSLICSCLTTTQVWAIDTFDRHSASILQSAIESQTGVTSFSSVDALKLKPLDRDLESSCIVIETRSGNLAKVLVSWGYRKSNAANDSKLITVLVLDRFVTYEKSRGDSTLANGKNIMLFPGYQFDFDIGQIVPAGFDADIELGDKGIIKALEKVKMYGLNGSQLPKSETESAPGGNARKKDSISPEDFSGVWKVDGDGRLQGEWELTVNEDGQATGKFLSSESQASYPISGQIGGQPHQIKLQIQFNNATQVVDAFLWTKDKSILAGTFVLEERKFGLFAVRHVNKR